MAAEEVTPPDLIGAGVTSPQQGGPDASSLMAQLRQPAMPTAMPADMSGLMSMPRQTPGQAYAQAAAGGVSAMTGAPNPVVQQNQDQRITAMQNAAMYQRVIDKRQAHQDKQDEAANVLLSDWIRDPNPDVRKNAAPQWAQIQERRTGMQIPDAVMNNIINRGPDNDSLKTLTREIVSDAYSDDQLQQKYVAKGGKAEDWPQVKAYLSSDANLQTIGYDRLKLQKEQFDVEKAGSEAWFAKNPEFKLGQANTEWAADQFRTLRGKPLSEADPKNPLDSIALKEAFASGQAKVKADEQEKRAWELNKIQVNADAAERLAGIRADASERMKTANENRREAGKPVGQGAWVDSKTGILTTPTQADYAKEPTRYRHLGASEEQMYTNTTTAQMMVHRLGDVMEGLIKEHGASTLADGLDDSLLAQGKRALIGSAQKNLRNDPNWAEFQNLMNETNIELARVVGGSGQLRTTVLEKLTEAGLKGWETKDVAHRVLGTIDTSITNRRDSIRYGGDPSKMQQYGPSPKESGQSPLNPKTPPGTKMEGGDLVSESGKYIWKGGVWIAR